MKKVLALIFIAILIVTVFSACGKSGASGKEIDFAAQSFSIVRPEGMDFNLVSGIFKALKENCNAKCRNIADTEEVNPAGEILIGNTNRPESAEALRTLTDKGTGRDEEYIICFINNSIAIQSFTDTGLKLAIEKFITDYCSTGKIKSDECFIVNLESNFETLSINGVDISEYQIVIPKYNLSPLVRREADDFVAMVKEKTGYMIPIVKDDTETQKYEFVLGNANRDGVETITEHTKYSVKVSDGKIFMNGGRNYSNTYAAQLVFDSIKVGENTVTASSGQYKKDEDGYMLVWDEEFDTLDTTKWNTRDVNHGNAERSKGGYGNWYGMNTARSDSSDSLWVENGKLYMNARYDDETFYGTWMDTSRRLEFTYGFIEISQKPADGQGIWSCLWTWSDNKQGHLEFDIVEVWGPASYYVSVVHELIYTSGTEDDTAPIFSYITLDNSYTYDEFWATDYWHHKEETSFWNDFHTFSCEWTEKDVTMFRDSEVTGYHWYLDPDLEFDHSYLYRQKHYLVLSMLTGSNYESKPDDADTARRPIIPGKGPETDPSAYAYWTNGRSASVVEYVQLFQKKGQPIDIFK